MKKIILFDLDGTLLDMNFDEFLSNYFGLLLPFLSKRIKGDIKRYVFESTDFMINKIDGRTNMEKFLSKFSELSGSEKSMIYNSFIEFYTHEFPKLSFLGRPKSQARETIIKLRESGVGIVLATNAIFPLLAIEERLRWADLEAALFDLITHMENMHSAKPHKEYYLEIMEKLKVKPEEVIMIGDDMERDILPARALGIDSYQIGKDIEIKNIYKLI